MELRHLRYFVAVAEVENVSLAAQRLHVSQPPLSRQIRQLEDELGVALFKRTAKSVHLTKAGKIFELEARRILNRVDQAVAAAREAAGAQPRELRIGYAPSLTVKILPESLRTFSQHRPGVKIQLHDLSTSEMIGHLRSGTLDLALVVYPGKTALRGFAFRELDRYPACAILPVSHPLAHADRLDVKDLAGEPVIAFSRSDYPEYHGWLASLFKATGKRPKVSEEHESITGLIAAVEAGNGIAFGGTGVRDMAGTRLKIRELAPPAPPIVVGAIYDKEWRSPAMQELFDEIFDPNSGHVTPDPKPSPRQNR